MKAEFFKNLEPFSLSRKDKLSFFKKEMRSLVHHHYIKSKVYKKLLNYFNYKMSNDKLENFPFLPTRLFKDLDLISVSKDKVFKILKSSGTSGSGPSKVYLDKVLIMGCGGSFYLPKRSPINHFRQFYLDKNGVPAAILSRFWGYCNFLTEYLDKMV